MNIKPSGRRSFAWAAALGLLVATVILAAAAGAVPVRAERVGGILLSRLPLVGRYIIHNWTIAEESIILRLRLPRIVLALATGATLALAGTAYQGVLQNPMADPYLIGVSSGAALGAALAIINNLQFSAFGFGAVPLAAFAGAVISLLLAYRLSRRGRTTPVLNLILTGVAVSSFFSALSSLVIFLGRERMEEVVFWMMGGLAGAEWGRIATVLPLMVSGAAVPVWYHRELNALSLGDEAAAHLGIDVPRVRQRVLLAASLATAAAVSVSGIIGFVGLVVPHMTRLAVGPDHRNLLPAAVTCGATLLVAADTAARTILAPAEIPVGVFTALLGAPFFLYLLQRGNQR